MKASTFSKEEAMARYVSVALSVVKSRGEEGATVVPSGVERCCRGGGVAVCERTSTRSGLRRSNNAHLNRSLGRKYAIGRQW